MNIKIYFNLLMYFASTVKESVKGICSPSISPMFTLSPLNSTLQQFP